MNSMLVRFAPILVALLVVGACSRSNDADPQAAPVGSTDTNRFWVFPNPGKDPATGSYTTNVASYAQAYYAAIDPGNARATLEGFKTVNNFGISETGVTEVNVIFRDARDLGYGRKMTVRFTDPSHVSYVAANHRVAVFVENYQVVPFAGDDYTALNLEAAITGNTDYHVGTNAIEYSIVGGRPMTRFYTYAPGTGIRLNTVNLDGRGQKAMPSVCINCHGGRADPLTATGVFPDGGNVRARLQPIHVDSVEFWSTAPYRRADQEEVLRQINYAVFCAHSYPLPGPVPASPDVDSCRPLPSSTTGGHDYQGAAADMMKVWYVAGINNTGATFADSYVPTNWQAANTGVPGSDALYTNVVAPYCRVCHITRGTENVPQDDIDFNSYAKFLSYADRIKAHVFERGNMPLGLLIYKQFWDSPAPEQLADWLSYVNAAYNPPRVGGGGSGQPVQPSGALSDPILLPVSGTPYRFADIKAILQSAYPGPDCVSCHNYDSAGVPGTPPIYYGKVTYPAPTYNRVLEDYDRNGDGFTNSYDDLEFYLALRGRINFTDLLASPLLRKPTGHHHGGGPILDLTNSAPCAVVDNPWCSASDPARDTWGEYYQSIYNIFLEWIQHGAPYN
jgi:hypothetical protein